MILLFVFYVSQRSSLLVVHCMVAGRANTATCLLTVSCLGPAHMVFRTEHLHPRTVAATTPRPRYQCTTQWKPGGMTGPWSLQGSYRRAGTGSRPRVTMRPTSRRDGASPRTASRPRHARPWFSPVPETESHSLAIPAWVFSPTQCDEKSRRDIPITGIHRETIQHV